MDIHDFRLQTRAPITIRRYEIAVDEIHYRPAEVVRVFRDEDLVLYEVYMTGAMDSNNPGPDARVIVYAEKPRDDRTFEEGRICRYDWDFDSDGWSSKISFPGHTPWTPERQVKAEARRLSRVGQR